jgi:hemerythrin superfamily protein
MTQDKVQHQNKSLNAVDMLIDDHKQVKKLFKEYQALVEKKAEGKLRAAVANSICDALTKHARMEEEVFYPALRKALDTDELLNEAYVEHATVKDLILQISRSTRRDGIYDARVKVLGEYVDHHVKEEEGEIFPNAKKTDLDLKILANKMSAVIRQDY